jgi:hypothetical protein
MSKPEHELSDSNSGTVKLRISGASPIKDLANQHRSPRHVGRLEHRDPLCTPNSIGVESSLDSTLAIAEDSGILPFRSKCFFLLDFVFLQNQ